jgi:hypothetical protein
MQDDLISQNLLTAIDRVRAAPADRQRTNLATS